MTRFVFAAILISLLALNGYGGEPPPVPPAVTNVLSDPTASWNVAGTTCIVSLYGVHTAPNLMKIEVYHNVGTGYKVSPVLAMPGVKADGTKFYTWAGGYGNGFKPGDQISYYTKLYYLDNQAVKTVDSNVKTITLPAKP